MLEGSLLPPDEAHFFWNGTWSNEARAALLSRPGLPPASRPAIPEDAVAAGNQPLHSARPVQLPAGRHPVQERPHEHGSLARSAAAFPRSPPGGVRGTPSRVLQGAGLDVEVRAAGPDAGQAAVLGADQRPKEGFDIPAHAGSAACSAPAAPTRSPARRSPRTGLFRWPAVWRVMDDHFARRGNYGYHLWGLLTFFLWMKRWNIQPPSTNGSELHPVTASATN